MSTLAKELVFLDDKIDKIKMTVPIGFHKDFREL